MRVLSFIPAFLLAAASFVAAAPTSTPTDTSCVSQPTGASTGGPTGGNGNDASLQPVISIIANATTHIQPLSGQLSALKGDSCTPDAVSGIVVQINAVVSTCVAQLQAAVQVDLTGLDLTNLCATIYGLLTLVLTVLNTLVTIICSLGMNAIGTIKDVIANLLHAVIDLVGCLRIFVNASLSGVLGPVISLVCGVVELLLSILVGAKIILGTN